MAIVKIIEVMAESDVSWEAAAKNAVEEASRTLNSILSVNVKNMQAIVEDNEIVRYRVNAKISFIVND
jgi:flavin-binding protein dodecin